MQKKPGRGQYKNGEIRSYVTWNDPIPFVAMVTHLSDRHCAEDVEKDKRTVGVVVAHEVAMGNTAQP